MNYGLLIISVIIVNLTLGSCEYRVADPVDPDPIDSLDEDPIDLDTIDILNKKWAGDYFGTVYRSSWNPSGHTADTLYNSKVTLSEFVSSTIYKPKIYPILNFRDTYIDSSYHTRAHVFVYDTLKIYHYLTGFSDTDSFIILNKQDSSLTYHYAYASIGSGLNINAYYVKK